MKVWTKERLYFSGDEYFDAMLAAIDDAQTSIDLETYIYYPDEMGRVLEDHLEKAAERGVRVRLLVDGIGALSWLGTWAPSLLYSGAQIRIWNPAYVGPFLPGVLKAIRRRGVARFFLILNRRTHRKYCIVDSKTAFVGSQNISREHLRRYSGSRAWRDTGVLIEGPEIQNLERAFDHGWDRAYTPSGHRRWLGRRRLPKLTTESLVRLNFTRAYRRRFRQDLLGRFRAARARIWITNPYLAPTNLLLKALIRAAKRGADVRLLVPSRSDVFFMRWVATSYYGRLLKNGVRIFEYQPTILHAKSMLIDDWAMVGTSNMNTRSFLHDLEVDIVITGEDAKRTLARKFEADLAVSREVLKADWRDRIWASRLGRLFSFLLRNWL